MDWNHVAYDRDQALVNTNECEIEVISATSMKTVVFWNGSLCSLIDIE